MKKAFIEQEDYYFNKEGLIVLTEKYLLERAFCCGNLCKHCPYTNPITVERIKSSDLNKSRMNAL